MNPYLIVAKAAAALALIAVLTAFSFHQGAASVQSKWDAARLAQIAADDDLREKRESLNAVLAARQQEANATIKKDNDEANQKITFAAGAARAHGLYVPTAACNRSSSPATASSASSSDDATTGSGKLPDALADDLISEAERADKMTEGYRALQEFIQQNGLAP